MSETVRSECFCVSKNVSKNRFQKKSIVIRAFGQKNPKIIKSQQIDRSAQQLVESRAINVDRK